MRGTCQFGQNCSFAHSPKELQPAPDLTKTRLCKAFVAGRCKDPKCTFAHGEEELRSTEMFYKMTLCSWYGKGRCRNGSQCHFAHGLADLRMYHEGKGSAASTCEGSVSAHDARGSSDSTSEADSSSKSQEGRHIRVQTGHGGDTPIQVDGSAGHHRQVRWSSADTARPITLPSSEPMYVQMSSFAPMAPEHAKEARVLARDEVPHSYASTRTPTAAPQVHIHLLSRAMGMLSRQMEALEVQMRGEQRPCSATEHDFAMWDHLKALAAMSANSTCPRTVGEYYPAAMSSS